MTFHRADYTEQLPFSDGSFDLLISLFAGPVLDACRRYLRPRGLLLANSSHGDASLAALDPDLRLVAVVSDHDGGYLLHHTELHLYLVPKRPASADTAHIRRTGRGIEYTRTAFAYLFRADGSG